MESLSLSVSQGSVLGLYVPMVAVLMTTSKFATCPRDCDCVLDDDHTTFTSTCTAGEHEHTIILSVIPGPQTEVIIRCQGENFKCTDIPHMQMAVNVTTIITEYCPENILSCVNNIFDKKPVVTMFTNTDAGKFVIDGVHGSTKAIKLHLNDMNRQMPITNIKLALPGIEEFTLESANFLYTANMFSDANDLAILNIRSSKVTTIPADAFSGLNKLKMFTYFDVTIDLVAANAFRGLDSLHMLLFENCKIKAFEPGAISTSPKSMSLSKLNITGHWLQAIPNGLLDGLQYLETVSIINSGEVEMQLGSNAFSHVPGLKHLLLSNANTKTLPENIFTGATEMDVLHLENNMIETLPSDVFARLTHLTQLHLQNNKLTQLPEYIFFYLKNLAILNLAYNNFETLPQALFHGLRGLTFLGLNNNHFKVITAEFYITLPVSDSDFEAGISDPNRSKYEYGLSNVRRVGSPFKFMPKLNALSLSNNHISHMYDGWEMDMLHVAQIDLSRNNFTDFEDFNVDYSNSQAIINLQYNNITNVMLDPRIIPDVSKPLKRFFILDNNPIVCDCSSYGLYQRLKGIRSHRDPVYIINQTPCSSPPQLKGKLLKNVLPDELACDMSQHLPNGCSKCTARIDTKQLVLNCSRMPPHLPNPRHKNITKYFFEEPALTLRLDAQPSSIEGYNIHTLNVSHTDIHTIDFHPTDSLKVLDLSHNDLRTIPNEFLNANITLYLSGNPLECKCDFVTHIDYLRRHELLPDFNQITCVNGDKIAMISVNVLCSRSLALVAQIGMGFFFLIIIISILKHSKDILQFISTTILRRPINPLEAFEMRIDAAKEYDLFISYAHDDSQFVTNSLLPKLENELKQKVCVHSRDWTVGDLITDQIIMSVERSRRTIIILTENFLVSEWAYLEFRTAHNLSIQEGKPRVILILLDEAIANDERLDFELKSYITINTYLLWGDPNFWEKLKKVVPKGTNKSSKVEK